MEPRERSKGHDSNHRLAAALHRRAVNHMKSRMPSSSILSNPGVTGSGISHLRRHGSSGPAQYIVFAWVCRGIRFSGQYARSSQQQVLAALASDRCAAWSISHAAQLSRSKSVQRGSSSITSQRLITPHGGQPREPELLQNEAAGHSRGPYLLLGFDDRAN